jgi:hypothetical protein
LNELEIEVRNKIEDRALYRNETIENELLNGIRNFEKNFKNYLQNELKLNEKDYSHNARKLLENI